MKLQQLRYVVEVARHELNVSLTADSLFTSQPGISKQIRLLEDELGVEIFERSGKHFVQITEVGRAIITQAEQILLQTENIKRLAREHLAPEEGKLDLVISHLHAHLLPRWLEVFEEKYPEVGLTLHQNSPRQMLQSLVSGRADFALSSLPISEHPELFCIPFCRFKRAIVLPCQHPLLEREGLGIRDLGRYPVFLYVSNCGRSSGMEYYFRQHGIEPNIKASLSDGELVLEMVKTCNGIGIIPSALLPVPMPAGLCQLHIEPALPDETGVIMFRKHRYLRQYMQDFIAICHGSNAILNHLHQPVQEWDDKALAHLPRLE